MTSADFSQFVVTMLSFRYCLLLGICETSFPSYPLNAPSYQVSVRQATISLSLLLA